MRYRLRTLMFIVFMVCVVATFHERIQVWWRSHTRPAVTFVGNTFDDCDLASVAGVPQFAELSWEQTRDAQDEMIRVYRKMGYLKARIDMERTATDRGWATRFVVNEGQHYDSDEVLEIVGRKLMEQNCTRHGSYLCLSPDGKTAATTTRPCPICDRTVR